MSDGQRKGGLYPSGQWILLMIFFPFGMPREALCLPGMIKKEVDVYNLSFGRAIEFQNRHESTAFLLKLDKGSENRVYYLSRCWTLER